MSPREMHLPGRLEMTLLPPRCALNSLSLEWSNFSGTDQFGAKLEEEKGEKLAEVSRTLNWVSGTVF